MTKPKGKLKISAPACLGRRYVAPALCEFMREYPEIEVEVDIADRPVNLQEDGYDVAIRTGALSDSSLIAKRLAPDRHVMVASPAYLARKGRPLRPEDLANHNCLVLGGGWQWSFTKNGAETSVRVGGSLRSNNGELLCHAALDGLGLIRTSELEVLSELESGKLVQVLPDFEVNTNAAVWALYPSAKHVLPRMRVLLDFLGTWFREARGEERAPEPAAQCLRRATAGPNGERLRGRAAPRRLISAPPGDPACGARPPSAAPCGSGIRGPCSPTSPSRLAG